MNQDGGNDGIIQNVGFGHEVSGTPPKRRATRAEIDAIAWKTIREAKPHNGSPCGYSKCGRPSNYCELGQMISDRDDFELAWSEFLHEFFRYRTASFFEEPPPQILSKGWRAILAGTAEYLSKEFNLPIPVWTEEAEYFLPMLWNPLEDWVPDMEQYRAEQIAKAHEIFLKRKVIFASRNLITL
jgi:hypothetical protein